MMKANMLKLPLVKPGKYKYGDLVRNTRGDLLICFEKDGEVTEQEMIYVIPKPFMRLWQHNDYNRKMEKDL